MQFLIVSFLCVRNTMIRIIILILCAVMINNKLRITSVNHMLNDNLEVYSFSV